MFVKSTFHLTIHLSIWFLQESHRGQVPLPACFESLCFSSLFNFAKCTNIFLHIIICSPTFPLFICPSYTQFELLWFTAFFSSAINCSFRLMFLYEIKSEPLDYINRSCHFIHLYYFSGWC